MKISEAYQHLHATYIDWSSFLTNRKYIRDNSRITWSERKPYVLDNPVMASDVAKLFEEGQYTFQIVEDGSLIQIYYNYNKSGDQLLAARLAFYSTQTYDQKIIKDALTLPEVPVLSSDLTEAEMLSDENVLDRIDSDYEGNIADLEDKPVSWLRIEYAPHDAKGVLHHDCHMHISAFPMSRFIVAGVPNPKQFIEFIAALCYPEAYAKHRLNEHGYYVNEAKIQSVNAICVPFIESKVFEQMPHFRIPFASATRKR